MMNYRISCYMFRNPERDDWMKKDEEISTMPDEPEPVSVGRRGSVLGNTWRKSKKLGRGMFKA